jgi:hypothetical protein
MRPRPSCRTACSVSSQASSVCGNVEVAWQIKAVTRGQHGTRRK